MFSESASSRKAIGDVDIVYHEGLYHLFHLVLPNHDFIAHAVSTNGINWRRVANALFIGDPGSWDDLMLWTMHVSPDPHREGHWRMFYTGLSRRDHGNVQRIGLARSSDLYHWKKEPVSWIDQRGPNDPDLIIQARKDADAREASARHAEFDGGSQFPLEPSPEHYESSLEEGRHWVSFRDPFYYRDNDNGWMLFAGRVKDGPIVRRGCVAVAKEDGKGQFKFKPALHHPGLYDDMEVPNLIKLGDEYYLIASLREDAKIRYWHTDKIGNPWRSYHDNVLMAAGNYAGRVCKDDRGWLVWNFYSMDQSDRTAENLMPPPKRLVRQDDGLLRVTSFEQFDEWVKEEVDSRCVRQLCEGAGEQFCAIDGHHLDLRGEAGFKVFSFDEELSCFRLRARLELNGKGKCGLVFRMNRDTRDGYYLSLDLLKGVAQLRAWGTNDAETGENMMSFRSLQSGYWYSDTIGNAAVQLIAFGSYIELSIDGRVILSLADQTFSHGQVGVYLETADLDLYDVQLHRMDSPSQSDDHLVSG